MVAQLVWDQWAAGSNPATPTNLIEMWAISSVGQSIRLITGRSWVQVPDGPPINFIVNSRRHVACDDVPR